MKNTIRLRLASLSGVILGLTLALPLYAQTDNQKLQAKGVIVNRAADSFTMRDQSGTNIVVTITGATEVKEKKANPFRGSKTYSLRDLLRGLNVEVEGYGSPAMITARKIRFTDDAFRVAQSIESRVNPVEGRLGDTEGRLRKSETRLSESERNAQRLSGQVEELSEISNATRGGAKAAQESADTALAGVRTAHERVAATNQRISALDDFAVKNNLIVHFRTGSSLLSKDAKTGLDRIAEQTKTEKGFVVEVAGFASSDGSESLNRRLSQRRADAVIRYLVENHGISLRRIITPYGYGEKLPIADNSTRDGRKQNRRVEVNILVSRGIVDPDGASSSIRNQQ